MVNPCKICGLDDGLRRAIERDIKMGVGVNRIVNMYRHINLNTQNIYSHKKHLILTEARDVYDKVLIEKMRAEVDAIDEIDIMKSPDKLKVSNQAMMQKVVATPSPSSKCLTSQMATNLIESGTTGNRIMDDVLLLDTIIQQGPLILEQVTPSNVMEAIKLKHNLLNGINTVDAVERKIEINMGILLQKISQENPEITIISEASVEETE